MLSLCPDHGNLLPLGGERMHRSDRLGVLGKTVVRNYSPGLEKYPRCCCKQTVLPKQVLEKPAEVIPLGIDFYLDDLIFILILLDFYSLDLVSLPSGSQQY